MMDIRLYQINRERDEERRALLSTEALARRGFGPKVIDSSIYDCVFEGTVNCSDLEEVYTLFNVDPRRIFLAIPCPCPMWWWKAERPFSVTASASGR